MKKIKFLALLAALLPMLLLAEEPAKRAVPAWLAKYYETQQARWAEDADGKPKAVLPNDVRLIVGNPIWQQGKSFKNGSDWFALLCNQDSCSFESANLKVKNESWQGHYDDFATMGQKLTFSLANSSKDKVVAWFKPTEKSSKWLRFGTVTTYSLANQLKRPKSKGTFEVQVDLTSGEKAVFVPMLDNLSESSNGALLQLRALGKRQILLGSLASCSGAEAMEFNPNYLLWAGDLDNDSKPDFLVSFIDAGGEVHLYLSSKAQADELVGLAASAFGDPFGGECDGYWW